MASTLDFNPHHSGSTMDASDHMHLGLGPTVGTNSGRDDSHTQQGVLPGWQGIGDSHVAAFDTAFQSEQVNMDDFLANLGFGSEGSQSTFDHLFLHPLPDFPAEEWSWDP
jgi:hypothetical protein